MILELFKIRICLNSVFASEAQPPMAKLDRDPKLLSILFLFEISVRFWLIVGTRYARPVPRPVTRARRAHRVQSIKLSRLNGDSPRRFLVVTASL